MEEESRARAIRLDEAIASRFGVIVPELDALRARVIADYHPDAWGLARFASIEDVVDRAVASDLVVSSLEGARTAVVAIGLRQRQHADLVGPNGRTMPGPETSVEFALEQIELDTCVTDCFRAVGSAMDCLAAASVLLTGAPLQVQRAEGSWFLRRLDEDRRPSPAAAQEQAWNEVAAAVTQEGNTPSRGWLAWSLETRNAVVHRGQLLRTWLNRPGRAAGSPQLLISTATDPAYLMRMEPHLRRSPWLPDMHAMTSPPRRTTELWLPEPAQRTLEHVRDGTVRIVERSARTLSAIWDAGMPGFVWPSDRWNLARRDDDWRLGLAAEFGGFEPEYPVPPPAQLRLHPDSAVRAHLAQNLLRRHQARRDPG